MEAQKDFIAACPSCSSKYKVPLAFRDRTLSCKKCGTSFRLGGPATPEARIEKADSIDSQDPCLILGRLLIKYRYANEEQLQDALAFQAKERKQGKDLHLGEILVMKGVISRNQLGCVLSVQSLMEARDLDIRFGSVAVQNGFATREDIDRALEEQKRHFKETKSLQRIGDILVEMGVMSPDQRDALLKGQVRMGAAEGEKEAAPSPEVPTAQQAFELSVSEDRLSAFLSFKGVDAPAPDIQRIKDLLASMGIMYGIVDDAALERYLKQGAGTKEPFKVAEGKPAVPGGEAQIRYHFDTDPLKVGTIKEGGYIDFRERGAIPQVKKGDLLAEKVAPEDGVPGVDVFGQSIPFHSARDVKLKRGKGARISSDGAKIYADVDGRPEIRADGKVYVFSDLEVHGNVDLKTGHVDFHGNIVVSGAVQSGFRVRGGSLTANEILKAEIETTGDVVVFGGIIGATIRAGGSVRARYVHEASVEVLGDLAVEKEIIDSKVEASGVCHVRKGHILSSHIQAKKGIEAGEVGSEASRPCTLVVGTNDRERNEIGRLKNDLALKKEEGKKREARLKALEEESQKIHHDMGAVAQDQDRAMVRERTLREKVEEAKKGKASTQLEEAEKVLEGLRQEMRDREKVLEGFLDSQDKVMDEISALQQESKAFEQEVAALVEEITALTEWSRAETGNPELRVHGSIHQYTTVKALHSTLTLPESHARVSIKETKVRGPDDKVEWKLRMSRL